ncbi:MAG: hypothetical protein ACRD1X_18010 [Vicinamibacteria bacterium]
MPTTVVEFAERTYSDHDYQSRLRRPVWLEGFGFTPVVFRPAATVYQPPPPATSLPPPQTEPSTEYVPSTYQEPPPDVELEPEPPAMPEAPVAKQTSPWVWVAGGTGALVVFWLFFRRKRKG